MPNRKHAIITGAVALAVVGGTALAAASLPSQTEPGGEPRYQVEIPEYASDAQREAIAAMLDDSPIPVQDQDGVRRGYVRDSALTERDERVNKQILTGFREYNGGEDPAYDQLYEALRVLDPVPVVDEDGATVGYFTHHFQTAEQITAASPAARALVEEEIG